MMPRVKVACINWGHHTGPKALVYMLVDGEMKFERYFPTWSEAVTFASAARKPVRSARAGHGAP